MLPRLIRAPAATTPRLDAAQVSPLDRNPGRADLLTWDRLLTCWLSRATSHSQLLTLALAPFLSQPRSARVTLRG